MISLSKYLLNHKEINKVLICVPNEDGEPVAPIEVVIDHHTRDIVTQGLALEQIIDVKVKRSVDDAVDERIDWNDNLHEDKIRSLFEELIDEWASNVTISLET